MIYKFHKQCKFKVGTHLGYFNQHISGRKGLRFYCWSHSPVSHSHPKRNRISQWKQPFIIIEWFGSEGTFREGL